MIEEVVEYAKIKFIVADNGIPINPWPCDEDGEDILPRLFYIHRWWQTMSGFREQGMGVGPITHCEILAFMTLYQVEISPAEIDTLQRIDTAFRIHEQEKNDTKRAIAEEERGTKPVRPQSLSDKTGDHADLENAKRLVAEHRAAAKKAKEAKADGR